MSKFKDVMIGHDSGQSPWSGQNATRTTRVSDLVGMLRRIFRIPLCPENWCLDAESRLLSREDRCRKVLQQSVNPRMVKKSQWLGNLTGRESSI